MSYDVFISYCHKDNLPLGFEEPPKRWAALFHERLKVLLTQALARDALIWRDERIAGEGITEAIEKALKDSKVLVPLLSPAFFESSWCPDEVTKFRDKLRDEGDAEDDARRIQPAIKLPPDPRSVEGHWSNRKGVNFYHVDEGSGMPYQWDPTVGEHAGRFIQALYELCYKLQKAIEPDNIPPPTRGSVYLGISDRIELLARTEREVTKLGFGISGQFDPIPSNQRAFEERVEDALDHSPLIVLLPGRRSIQQDGFDVEQVEWSRILPRLVQGSHRCIAWVDDGRRPDEGGRKEWLVELERTVGVELLRCSFQIFLSNLSTDLSGAEKRVARVHVTDRPLILADWHECDEVHPLLAPFREALRSLSQKFEVVEPEADLHLSRDKWNAAAERACAAVFFSARSPASWIKGNYDTLVRRRPMLARRVFACLGPDGAEDKRELLGSRELHYLNAEPPEDLLGALEALVGGGES
jgi:hypothetical protein